MVQNESLFKGKEYIYSVYKAGSFTHAAENLGISQPSLSANVKRIEKRIGYPVFDRSINPLGLTEAGKTYVQTAEQIMLLERGYANYIQELNGLKTGTLVIGGSSLYVSMVLPQLISKFYGFYPHVKVSLKEEILTKLVSMLYSGEIDILIESFALDPTIFKRKLFKEETLFLAVPEFFDSAKHAQRQSLTKEIIVNGKWKNDIVKPVSLKLFKNDPYILQKPQTDTGSRSIQLLKAAGINPKTILEVDQQLTSFLIANCGLGNTFISDTLIKSLNFSDKMLYFKLPGEICHRNLWFYYKERKYMSKAIDEFLRISCESG